MSSDTAKAASALVDAMGYEAHERDQKRARLLDKLISEQRLAERQSVANVRDDRTWSPSKRMAVSLGYDPDEYDIDFPRPPLK